MAKLDFSYLVAPFTATEFFDQYWQKTALLIKRDETDRYRSLIDATDAAAILSMASELPAAEVEVIGGIQTSETSQANQQTCWPTCSAKARRFG